MNEIKIFENKELDLQVRIKMNEDGSISMNAEDTAIGFGWCRTEKKNGKEYTSVMWSRMNGYCRELGFAHECAKDDYIPESLYYLLGMKAGNERALKYQKWLAIDVLPTLRKTGKYEMPKKEAVQKQEKLSSVNMAANTLRKTLVEAGVPAMFIATAVMGLYKEKAGININVPIPADTPKLYGCEDIAKEVGIYSKSGLPHKQAVATIIRLLNVADQDKANVPYENNGHNGITTQYKTCVLDQVKEWVADWHYPKGIYDDNGKHYVVHYQ